MNVGELPSLGCIFCEDIRHEVTGLSSFIGVMPGAIFLPSYPCQLAKFGIAISWLFDKNEIPETLNVQLVVPWQAEPIKIQQLDTRGLQFQMKNEDDPDSIGAWTSCRAVLSPFPVPSPGRIRAEVNTGSGWRIAGTLRFREMVRPQEAASPDLGGR